MVSSGLITATGVEFEHGGTVYQFHARKEVVISAGKVFYVVE